MDGFIKLYRCLKKSNLWLSSTPEQKVILITLLLIVKHSQGYTDYKGEKYFVNPGQCVTSIDELVKTGGLGITTSKVRTALNKFEKYGFLTKEPTNQNTIITIVNWNNYQGNNIVVEGGYIQLHRKLIEKAIWTCSPPKQKVIFITLLLMVNYQESQWEYNYEKYSVKPGQCVTSVESIKQAAGNGKNISTKNVRTALKKFINYGFISKTPSPQNTIITIVNWKHYQSYYKPLVTELPDNEKNANNNTENDLQKSNNDHEIQNNYTKDHIEECDTVIKYLNHKCNTKYVTDNKTINLINEIFNEGYKLEDFYKVIDYKAKQWIKTEFEMYLRPKTLFEKEKFTSYLSQAKYENKKPKNRFHNFEQRTLDYSEEELEKLLRKKFFERIGEEPGFEEPGFKELEFEEHGFEEPGFKELEFEEHV